MDLQAITKRDLIEQLRYHYSYHRELTRTIQALERLKQLRESAIPAMKTLRRRSRKAA
jgi:hypothetical protein